MLKDKIDMLVQLKDVAVGLSIVTNGKFVDMNTRNKTNDVLITVLKRIDSYFNKK